MTDTPDTLSVEQLDELEKAVQAEADTAARPGESLGQRGVRIMRAIEVRGSLTRKFLPSLLALARQAHAQRWRRFGEESPKPGVEVLVCPECGEDKVVKAAMSPSLRYWMVGSQIMRATVGDQWQPITIPAATQPAGAERGEGNGE